MQVKMIAGLSGLRDGVEWPAPGGVIDLPADEAVHLVAAGLAAETAVQAPAEKAVAASPERATPAPAEKRGRK